MATTHTHPSSTPYAVLVFVSTMQRRETRPVLPFEMTIDPLDSSRDPFFKGSHSAPPHVFFDPLHVLGDSRVTHSLARLHPTPCIGGVLVQQFERVVQHRLRFLRVIPGHSRSYYHSA